MKGRPGQTWELTTVDANGVVVELWQFLIVRSYVKDGKDLHDYLDLTTKGEGVMADASLDVDFTSSTGDRLTVKRLA